MIATAGLTVGYRRWFISDRLNNVTRQEFAVFLARGLNESFRVSSTPIGQPIKEDDGQLGKLGHFKRTFGSLVQMILLLVA